MSTQLTRRGPGLAIGLGLLGLIPDLRKFRVPPAFWWCLAFYACAALSRVAPTVADPGWRPVNDYGKVLLITLIVTNALRAESQVSGFLILWLGCFAVWPVRGTLLNWLAGIGEFGRYHWNFIFQNPNDLAGIILLILGLTLVASRAGGRQLRILSRRLGSSRESAE